MDEVFFPQKTHTICLLWLLSFCRVLSQKVGLAAVIYFGRISCFLATWSRKTKSWLSQKDLAMFSLFSSHQELTWTQGQEYAVNTLEKIGPYPARVLDNVSPGTVLPEPFYISVARWAKRLRENNGKFEEEAPTLVK